MSNSTTTGQAARIAAEMEAARARTLSLFDLADEAHLHESPGCGFRPIIWHLAHIGVFESYWLLQKLSGEPAPDGRYLRLFDPIATPREESKNLPTRREMEAYLARVRGRSLEHLARADFGSADPLARGGYAFRLVLEHERQHQETLAYLLQMLAPRKKTRPRGRGHDSGEERADGGPPSHNDGARHEGDTTSATARGRMTTVCAGPFALGAAGAPGDQFAYDNELPRQEVLLPSFKIDRLPATNADFAEFVEEGGYRRRELWSDEGWGWRGRENWQSPLYWRLDGDVWVEQRMFDEGPPPADHPVTGVSWYEAEAYARFRGKRLPTEVEWEKAASWDEARARKNRFAWGDAEPTRALCNFDLQDWGTTPAGNFGAGASPYGCLDMTGNVWEWTATPFDGYAGFEPFPYPEYSQVWFDGDHRVLKGGSWATSASLLRTSFRNFFRRHSRIAFAGIRLAQDD
jgi:iron(II)-dependent oxidoreductase